ncbi:MAG: rhodanese-like domain-containing protein, partial [Planctomycetota bacterium]
MTTEPQSPKVSAPELDDRGLPRGSRFHPADEVTPREAAAAMRGAGGGGGGGGGGGVLIVDVRLRSEWDTARIEGSVHIPLHELEQRWDELETQGKEVLVLCHHGRRSLDGMHILRSKGIAGAKSIAGGIEV